MCIWPDSPPFRLSRRDGPLGGADKNWAIKEGSYAEFFCPHSPLSKSNVFDCASDTTYLIFTIQWTYEKPNVSGHFYPAACLGPVNMYFMWERCMSRRLSRYVGNRPEIGQNSPIWLLLQTFPLPKEPARVLGEEELRQSPSRRYLPISVEVIRLTATKNQGPMRETYRDISHTPSSWVFFFWRSNHGDKVSVKKKQVCRGFYELCFHFVS